MKRSGVIFILVLSVVCSRAVVAQGREEPMSGRTFEEWLVALNVDESLAVEAAIAFDRYTRNSDALNDTWHDCYQWLEEQPRERYVGRVPYDLDDKDKTLGHLKEPMYDALYVNVPRFFRANETRFFDDLRGILPENLNAVSGFERMWRRMRLLHTFRSTYGSQVDLLALITTAIPSVQDLPEVASILKEWEIRHDAILIDQQRAVRDQREQDEPLIFRENDFDDGCRIMTDVRIAMDFLAHELSRHNQETIDQLTDQLPEEDAEILRDAWFRAAIPFIWQRQDEAGLIDNALARGDISPQSREQLHALREKLDTLRRDGNDIRAAERAVHRSGP